jgi:hypothetical protein
MPLIAFLIPYSVSRVSNILDFKYHTVKTISFIFCLVNYSICYCKIGLSFISINSFGFSKVNGISLLP